MTVINDLDSALECLENMQSMPVAYPHETAQWLLSAPGYSALSQDLSAIEDCLIKVKGDYPNLDDEEGSVFSNAREASWKMRAALAAVSSIDRDASDDDKLGLMAYKVSSFAADYRALNIAVHQVRKDISS